MNRDVQIFIKGKRVELFNDEKISVNSSIQNISDITKVFTDFSQSFTVPASTINNAIFQHFYQSDVDATLDYNIRLDAFIEVDLAFFRRGKISLEKANLKKGAVESYTITFYGDVRTLKDAFGEKKLSELDYSVFNHAHNGTEVKNRITDGATDYSVRYPLISSVRSWEDVGTTNNITISGGAISYLELMPALKVTKIFDMIQVGFGVSFVGPFLLTDQFTQAFQYYKSKVATGFPSGAQDVNLLSSASPANGSFYTLDYVNNTISYFTGFSQYFGLPYTVELIISELTGAELSETFYIDVYRNGVINNTVTAIGNGTKQVFTEPFQFGQSETTLSFKIRSNNQLIMDVLIRLYGFKQLEEISSPGLIEINCGNLDTVSIINLAAIAPDIKIADYFSGILKLFNLTCYGIAENIYRIEPVDTWYSKGAVIDITKYVDLEAIEIERIKLYKRISFEHQQSQSLINRQFNTFNNREYGSLNNVWDYDGDELIVKVPFENLLFQKFTGTNLQVGYCLNENLQGYIPKPILLYKYTNKPVSFYFNDEAGTTEITSYAPMGQDLISNQSNFSLNFGQDESSLLDASVPNSIYSIYYRGYIQNLFDSKQRLTRLKAILPTSLLTSLQLNDRLVIRDKRYIINEMKSFCIILCVQFQLLLSLYIS